MLNGPNSFVIFCFVMCGLIASLVFAITSWLDGEPVMATLYAFCGAGIVFGIFV